MQPEPPGRPALAPGERVLARLKPVGAGRYEGRTMRRLADAPGRVLGVFRHGRGENRSVPTDRRAKAEWIVPPGQDGGAEPGEIVLAEPLPHHHRLGLKPARVIERLGNMGDARSVSLIVDPYPRHPGRAFSDGGAGRGGARRRHAARPPHRSARHPAGDDRRRGRARLRRCGVRRTGFAAAGGFRLIVAIADVAHYVRPGSALDHAARTRGNSVYFPDRVVPMLPEALSNGWCSLRPDEDRGCLFVELRIDARRPQDWRTASAAG